MGRKSNLSTQDYHDSVKCLNTAARATNANSIGIQVAGNNIANASNPKYVREVVQFATVPPTRQGSLNIGNGAVAQEISRKVNSSLQERAVSRRVIPLPILLVPKHWRVRKD